MHGKVTLWPQNSECTFVVCSFSNLQFSLVISKCVFDLRDKKYEETTDQGQRDFSVGLVNNRVIDIMTMRGV